MTNPPKIEALFKIEGHFVNELKVVLGSEHVIENSDYLDAGFDQALRLEGNHLLLFHTAEKAAKATTIWNKHLIGRPGAAKSPIAVPQRTGRS
jgi:hypothetical protein